VFRNSVEISVRVSRSIKIGVALAVLSLAGAGCGADDDDDSPMAGMSGAGAGGMSGSTPSAGTSGTPAAGASGAAAGSGAAGTAGGSAGSAGSAGAAGSAGSAGAAGGGAGSAGSAGSAGAGGMGGGAGMAGGGSLGGPLKYTGTFTMGTSIPPANKCTNAEGQNKSPALKWMGGPAATKSFAVVLYDVQYNMLHWVLWDIPPTVNELPEGLPSGFALTNPAGAHQASNMGADKHAYYGPCSGPPTFIPAGTYEYRLYALNKDKLDLTESSAATAAQTAVEGAMLEMTKFSAMPGM
jgi:Raf kinase inhibitor-like YbhB/YbcL family protein